jgi:hypothetical protein
MAAKTFTVKCKDGANVRVPLYASFSYAVQGEVFNFVIVRAVHGVNKTLTHRESTLRVADLGATPTHLKKFMAAGSDEARGRVVLDELVAKHGEAKLRAILAKAMPA